MKDSVYDVFNDVSLTAGPTSVFWTSMQTCHQLAHCSVDFSDWLGHSGQLWYCPCFACTGHRRSFLLTLKSMKKACCMNWFSDCGWHCQVNIAVDQKTWLAMMNIYNHQTINKCYYSYIIFTSQIASGLYRRLSDSKSPQFSYYLQ